MFTSKPAELLQLDRGTLSVGAIADVTLIDSQREWTVRANEFASASCNTPFDDWQLKGRAVRTIVRGETVWSC
jgi:dihydroorotase